ncbi:hypothetical protein E2C01_043360 [Portunus trituberculatus]|uniref:Uncharacterized protein n=1 Tax=Portunus trituberculatus TaxID=210409 RepID=A0A5B7FX42_PORTR|nr:hypothetical protein [Portunus trituberculatus]
MTVLAAHYTVHTLHFLRHTRLTTSNNAIKRNVYRLSCPSAPPHCSTTKINNETQKSSPTSKGLAWRLAPGINKACLLCAGVTGAALIKMREMLAGEVREALTLAVIFASVW